MAIPQMLLDILLRCVPVYGSHTLKFGKGDGLSISALARGIFCHPGANSYAYSWV